MGRAVTYKSEKKRQKVEGYIPVKDYAKKKGVTTQSVYSKLKRGTLRCITVGDFTLVKYE